jgi:hypothetical protein
MELETDVAVFASEIQELCSLCIEVSESQECVESRLVARGDGVEGHKVLEAMGTLLKGSERF